SISVSFIFFCFFFHHPATTDIYTLSLHDALPISQIAASISGSSAWASWAETWGATSSPKATRFPSSARGPLKWKIPGSAWGPSRSEEHTAELQSPCNLVCRLLLEKKKTKQ